MSKVIDEKNSGEGLVQCPNCGKLIQYTNDDKKGDYESTPFGTVHWEYITCPNCNHEIQF